MKIFICLTIFVSVLCCDLVDYTSRGDNWKAVCGKGHRQSPIDIQTDSLTHDHNFGLNWDNLGPMPNSDVDTSCKKIQIRDNNGTWTTTFSRNGTAKNFTFDHIHFHFGAEHTVDGKRYDTEMHMVHTSEDELLVLGVLFSTEGVANNDDFLGEMDLSNRTTTVNVKVKELIEGMSSRSFYHYAGSLTTPPCSEIVNWIVFAEPQYVSADTLEFMKEHLGESYRNTQPLNG